jgi:transposase
LQEQFAEKFPETPVPHRSAFRRLIEKFHETGSVLDAKRGGRPSKRNNEKLLDISDYAAESIKITVQVGTRGKCQACSSA